MTDTFCETCRVSATCVEPAFVRLVEYQTSTGCVEACSMSVTFLP